MQINIPVPETLSSDEHENVTTVGAGKREKNICMFRKDQLSTPGVEWMSRRLSIYDSMFNNYSRNTVMH